MKTLKVKSPKLSHHRGVERGYITLTQDGKEKEHYFKGKWPREQKDPPPDIYAQYIQRCSEILGGTYPPRGPVRAGVTIDGLWRLYEKYCREYHVKKGRLTSQFNCIKAAVQVLLDKYGREPAEAMNPVWLDEVIQHMSGAGWSENTLGTHASRNTINLYASQIRRMFAWGVRKMLVPATVWQGLKAVPGLRKNRGGREPKEVQAVTDAVLNATIPHLPGTLPDLVRVHRLIGCRAAEVCAMRKCELTVDPGKPGLWIFEPTDSKNDAVYRVGPRAQKILEPLMLQKNTGDYLFTTNRRRGRGSWTTNSYRVAVSRVCKAKHIELWTPLQVRHSAGEEARHNHPMGVEATQARLDHEDVQTSQIYAHKKVKLQQELAEMFG